MKIETNLKWLISASHDQHDLWATSHRWPPDIAVSLSSVKSAQLFVRCKMSEPLILLIHYAAGEAAPQRDNSANSANPYKAFQPTHTSAAGCHFDSLSVHLWTERTSDFRRMVTAHLKQPHIQVHTTYYPAWRLRTGSTIVLHHSVSNDLGSCYILHYKS